MIRLTPDELKAFIVLVAEDETTREENMIGFDPPSSLAAPYLEIRNIFTRLSDRLEDIAGDTNRTSDELTSEDLANMLGLTWTSKHQAGIGKKSETLNPVEYRMYVQLQRFWNKLYDKVTRMIEERREQ